METKKRKLFPRDYRDYSTLVENIIRLCKGQVVSNISTCRTRNHAIRFQLSMHQKKYDFKGSFHVEEAI